MKHLLLAALLATPLLTSCGNNRTQPNLNNAEDTIAYELGMAQSPEEEQLKQYLASQMVGSDSAYVEEFMRGLQEGLNGATDKKKAAYYAGLQTGAQIGKGMEQMEKQIFSDSTRTLSRKNFMAGFKAGMNKRTALKIDGKLIDREGAQMDIQQRIQKLTAEVQAEKYKENKTASDKFIAAKAKEAGIQKLPGGTLYKVITEGTGGHVTDGQLANITYEGRLMDGTVFDKSDQTGQNQPIPMQVGNAIPGFNEALKAMPIGSTWEIYLPYDQAYGAEGAGQAIAPFSAIIFKVTLVGIYEQPK